MALTPNQAKLKAFVAGHIANAAKKSPGAADDYLMRWADWVGAQMDKLDDPDATPDHLIGLTAFDLADARDRLASAAVQASAARAA